MTISCMMPPALKALHQIVVVMLENRKLMNLFLLGLVVKGASSLEVQFSVKSTLIMNLLKEQSSEAEMVEITSSGVDDVISEKNC